MLLLHCVLILSLMELKWDRNWHVSVKRLLKLCLASTLAGFEPGYWIDGMRNRRQCLCIVFRAGKVSGAVGGCIVGAAAYAANTISADHYCGASKCMLILVCCLAVESFDMLQIS